MASPPKCYALLHLKWKQLPVSYLVNPALEEKDPGAAFAAAEAWNATVSPELFSDTYGVDPDANWDISAPDGRNELSLGDYPKPGVIAVTVIWYVPKGRKIVEFDIVFDTDYACGDADPNHPWVMDSQNIATHEFGHGAGLDDVYQDACSEVTMYGYSEYGEIKKRSLELPDVQGTQKLYE